MCTEPDCSHCYSNGDSLVVFFGQEAMGYGSILFNVAYIPGVSSSGICLWSHLALRS